MADVEFCMGCFVLMPAGAKACPACGQPATTQGLEDFRDKLLHALRHPLADVRMRAIIALGWRAEEAAAGPLIECAPRNRIDVVEGLAVVESLRHLRSGRPHIPALQTLLARHPSRAVKRAAFEAAAEGSGEECAAVHTDDSAPG